MTQSDLVRISPTALGPVPSASIATVMMAVLAARTLVEMQTERNNAYRPEIVIVQNTFEGGKVSLSETEISGNCTYFDPYASAPDWILHPEYESIKDEAYYFESPYLTLKNIGQGTAKDIKVTFLINDWLKRAVDCLNDSDEGPFKFKELQSNSSDPARNRSEVFYSESEEDVPQVFIASNGITEKDYTNITYIESGEDAVDVALPKSWCKMLAVIYSLRMQLFASMETTDYATMHIGLPDLIITIQYSDMQGKQYKQEESIPWDAYCKYLHTTESAGDGNQPLYLWTNIYDDYIR